MRFYLVLLLIAISACSQDNISKEQAFVLKTTKEIISNIDLLEPRISDHINNKDVNIKNEIFLSSWISTIKATQNFDNKIVVEIQEHQPVASLNGGRFLTQDGRIITPIDESKELKLISIYGSDSEVGELLSYARLLQNILNLKGDHLTSFKHMGSSFIEAHDNKDTKYSFTKGDFRVQLERLEQLILFELNSGKIDHNRYIDLRYKNAIAVSRKKNGEENMSNVSRNEMLVGVDIGTSKVVAIVAEARGSQIEIIGLGTHASKGLKNGVVVDIESTTTAIKKSIEEAESMAGCHIGSCYVGISGSHIRGLNSEGVVPIRDGEVKFTDVDRVIETAQAMAIPADQRLLHVLPRDYIIDKQDGIKEPLGMAGSRLEAKVHLVTCSENSSQNIHKCISASGLDVEAFVLEQLASSYSVLTEDERNLGVCLIDIGGGTTDIAVFVDGSICFTDVIPIAGDHVTNDIAQALRTPPTQAETIKQRYGCAVSSMTRPEEIMMVPGMGGRPERELSRQALADVLERRYVEIFSMAQQKLSLSGFDELIPAGIVLTGGASKIEGATDLAEEIFHSPVRMGSPHSVEGFSEIINNPIYATSVGLLLYGKKQMQEDHMNYIHRDKNILNRISRWFGGNL